MLDSIIMRYLRRIHTGLVKRRWVFRQALQQAQEFTESTVVILLFRRCNLRLALRMLGCTRSLGCCTGDRCRDRSIDSGRGF